MKSPATAKISPDAATPKLTKLGFSPLMARQWYAGTKTQTRRAIKPQPPEGYNFDHSRLCAVTGNYTAFFLNKKRTSAKSASCRYGKAGDHVWIAESLIPIDGIVHYETDRAPVQGGIHRWEWKVKQLYAMYMPHWACRSTAVIEEIRTQRVNRISHKDAMAEGIIFESADPPFYYIDGDDTRASYADDPRRSYAGLWNLINGKKSWDTDPWVFALTLRRLT